MRLTDTLIRNAKPEARERKLSDGGGLFLLVHPNGAKYWRLAYRFQGKQKKLSIGVYPRVGLAKARKARDAAKDLLAAGVDPSEKKKLDRLHAKTTAENTFEAIGEEWLAKEEREKKAPMTLAKGQWLLRDIAFPVLGRRPIAEITAPEVLAALRPVEKRGRLETARRLRSTISRVFRYAIATGRADRDPAADLQGALTAPTVKHRAALLDPEAIGGLLRAIDAYEGWGTVTAALRLAPLVFVRPGELRHAEWSEINLDKAEWRIPAAKMKMRDEHIVPLSRQAVAILREWHGVTGRGRYVFPSGRSTHRPMSEVAVLAALRRMGYGRDEMTGHGFRSMASTILNEMGFNPDWIERQLAHGERNKVRAAYNRAQYLPERRRMMQAWADYLDKLRAGKGKVVAGQFGGSI